jgi:hypothetical protein
MPWGKHGADSKRAPVLPSDAALIVQRPSGLVDGSCPERIEVCYIALRHAPRRRRHDFDPYFVARCECGWLGEARDAQEPHALEAACAEGFGHGAHVEPLVVRMLD